MIAAIQKMESCKMAKPKTGGLTERFCDSVKGAEARVDYRDDKIPGLYFRVTPNSVKSWSLLYTDKRSGKKRRLDLGRFIPGQEDKKLEDREGVTLAKARQLARVQLADVGDGADPARGVSMRRDAATFQDLAELKLSEMRPLKGGRKRRSLENYRSMLRRHVYPAIGALKASEIKKADIKVMLKAVAGADDARFHKIGSKSKVGRDREAKTILERGRKVSHQPNRVFEMVRSIFRWAAGEDHIERDPISGMKPPVEASGGRKRSLSEAEISVFWRTLDAAAICRALALVMKLEIVTGQRTGELIRRLKTDIDRSGEVPILLIPDGDTKNERVHRVPLSPLAMSLIDEAMALDPNSNFIFTSTVRDAPLTPEAATKAMGRLLLKGKVVDLRVHDLRRTASNGMRRCKVPKFIVSVVLNHISATKSDVTSEHYLDEFAFETEKTEALFKWGAKLEEILAASNIRVASIPDVSPTDSEVSTSQPTWGDIHNCSNQ
jgi:integrase